MTGKIGRFVIVEVKEEEVVEVKEKVVEVEVKSGVKE